MKSKKLAIALASVVAFLSGCGSSNNNNGNPTSAYGGQCAQWNGNTCVAYVSGGCVPISQPIYFTGTAQSNYGYLLGGKVPSVPLMNIMPGNYGAMTVGTSGYNTGGTSWTSPSGLTLYTNGYGSSAVNVSGQMQLSQAVQQNILANMSYYGGSYGSSACVSNIGFQLYPYTSVNGVTGYMFLYLNGSTDHGYTVYIY